MNHIHIISTGGTFNTTYNPKTGGLEVENISHSVSTMLQHFYNLQYTFSDIINKDSLDMQESDRQLIVDEILQTDQKWVLIIHGTETIDQTAQYIEDHITDKTIILTGSMLPFYFNPIEATGNFALCIGYLLNEQTPSGVYIGMNGAVQKRTLIWKDRTAGLFKVKAKSDIKPTKKCQ